MQYYRAFIKWKRTKIKGKSVGTPKPLVLAGPPFIRRLLFLCVGGPCARLPTKLLTCARYAVKSTEIFGWLDTRGKGYCYIREIEFDRFLLGTARRNRGNRSAADRNASVTHTGSGQASRLIIRKAVGFSRVHKFSIVKSYKI